MDLVRRHEARHQLGIEYVVADARQYVPSEPVDLAVAAYFLNHAQTRDELQAMCDGIARGLKPGSRFVTVNSSPFLNFSTAPSFRKFGFETSVVGEWREGAPITWTFYLGDSVFEIENYFLDAAIHEAALRQAGFQQIRWHQPRLSPEGLRVQDPSFWATLLENSPVTFLECWK